MAREPKGLRGQLISHLREKKDWVHKGDIQNIKWFNSRNGTQYIPDAVGVNLRWLERNHYIAVKADRNNKSVLYKYIPSYPEDLRRRYIPTSQRPEGEEGILFRDGKVVIKEEVSEEEIMSYMNS